MRSSHVLVGVVFVSMLPWLFGLRFNLTPSLPIGIYRVTDDPPGRGSIVYVCLPIEVAEFARKRGYLGAGRCPGDVRPLGKVVVAVEGDIVGLERNAVRVNGAALPNSATVSDDSQGRALPHQPWGDRRLSSGELWLFSPYHRNALDSRYYGPVRESQVVSRLEPAWTWSISSPR